MVIARAITPEGRTVELDLHAWEHVLRRHPAMMELLDEMMSAISQPDFREADVRVGRERFFARVAGAGWVRVVTEFSGDVDRVVTAFPQLTDPRRRPPRSGSDSMSSIRSPTTKSETCSTSDAALLSGAW